MAETLSRTLIERLDSLATQMGEAPAISFIASGDPDGEMVRLSFADLVAGTRRRANALARLGIGPGDVIAFAAPPGEHGYPTLIAGMVSASLATVNYFLEPEALIRLIRATGARLLLTHAVFADDPNAPEKFRRVRAALPALRHVSFGPGPVPEGAIDLEALAAAEPGDVWTMPDPRDADRVVAIFHTGGTTGLPKLVPHTEAMYDAVLDACGAATGTRVGEIIMGGLPLFHTSGALQTGMIPLFNGTHVILPSAKGFRDPGIIRNYWRFVDRFGVTIGTMVPTMMAALTATEVDSDVSSLKHILCGAAPLSRATIAAIMEKTGGAAVIEGWGMTETCGFSVLNPMGGTRIGSVGVPFPGVELEIREASVEGEPGARLGPDRIGELVVRGNIVITRYADHRPKLFTADGWLRTGDLARIDADGYLWIAGRLKDVIIRGGHNIDPALIEEPAYHHPAVQLAAAIGRPDKYAGELPILFVQLKPGAQATPEEIEQFVRERVQERAASPKAVHIVAEIPLSGPGKISKLALRREAARAVFQQELDALELGANIIATPVDDERAGLVIELAIVDGSRPEATTAEKIAAALDGYAISHRWTKNGEPA